MLDTIVDKAFVSIDWDPGTLRIVHARATARSVKVDQVLGVPIPADVAIDDAESFGRFVREALDKARIRTRRAVVHVPRDQVNLCTLKLPKAPLSDLASMVAFQIARELPFPVDQAVVDFVVPPEEQQQDTNDVLVAAIRKDRLDFFRQVFEHAGLKLQRIGLRPNANQTAVNALLQATPRERVLFIDVGPETTEIDVLRDGRLVFSRAAAVSIPDEFSGSSSRTSVAESGEDEASALSIVPSGPSGDSLEAVVKELMIELKRSIEAYRAIDPGGSMDHAVVGGGCDIEEALTEAVQREYNITAQTYNPAVCFGWDADRGAAAGAFAATLGLVLAQVQEPQLKFDFLFPKKMETRTQRQIKKAPLALATAAVFFAAGVVLYFNTIKPQNETREALLAQVDEIERTLDEHAEFKQIVSLLEKYEQQQIVWVDQLHDFLAVLPDEKKMVLNRIDMSQKDHQIKAPFRASDAHVGSESLEALQGVRVPDGDRPQFEVVLGGTGSKPGQKYPYTGTLIVQMVDREWETDSKRNRRGGK